MPSSSSKTARKLGRGQPPAVIRRGNAAKVGSSLLSARNELGTRQATFMGVALSVKFSTSIVLIKLLFERGLIGQELYSLLIASKVGFKFIVPFLLAWMARRWHLERQDSKSEAPAST